MATNAAIIRKTEEGNYEGISCHFDGYLEHVGKILLEHYTDPAKVKALIALGNISSLGERVDPIGPHSYANPERDTTVAYHRDRGEEALRITTKRTLLAIDDHFSADYLYYFEDGAWFVGSGHPLRVAMDALKSTNQDA